MLIKSLKIYTILKILKKMKYAYLDFEFNGTEEEILNLVCATITSYKGTEEFWLLQNSVNQSKLKNYLQLLKNEGVILVGYQTVAEARSLYSLGLNPMDFEWIDLFLEYKCLTNHNDELMYGNQLVNGKVKLTKRPPPKWKRTEEDIKSAFRPTHSLAECTYKLTDQIRDTEHKDKMRDIILSRDNSLILKHQKEIQEYCTTDVLFLDKIHKEINSNYKSLLKSGYIEDWITEDQLFRGRYAALTAIRESKGYPINVEQTRNLTKNIPIILKECQRDINSQFDWKVFKYKRKEDVFSWNQIGTKAWLEENVDTNKWLKTDKKQLSLSKDAFEKHFPYRHDYPRNNFGAQILRYLKLKQALNGFKEGGKTGSFWDYVGKDGRVRPYMGIYGSQSSRSQPAAKSFMMLKPSWTRSLCQAKPGKAYVGIDYGSEEFFISALMSEDQKMIDAYLSGDVYLAFAKDAGMVPPDGTRENYPKERNVCKSTVLGISYDMTKVGLAAKLTNDTGEKWTEEDAQKMIDLFNNTYEGFTEYKIAIQGNYRAEKYIFLADGWYMWGDNDNPRSVGNCPIQGMGAAIMRRADLFCYDKNLYSPFTLHDALYFEIDSDDFAAIDTAVECMKEAFAWPFDGKYKELARKIRTDVEIWSPDYIDGTKATTPGGIKLNLETIHIDPRGKNEYEQFSKYYNDLDEGLF